jgi:hypothetical protein
MASQENEARGGGESGSTVREMAEQEDTRVTRPASRGSEPLPGIGKRKRIASAISFSDSWQQDIEQSSRC